MRNFSVMAMGVYPYITASIIIQLLTPIIPQLRGDGPEGESGRNRVNKITYYITVPLAFLQAIGQIRLIGFSLPVAWNRLCRISACLQRDIYCPR